MLPVSSSYKFINRFISVGDIKERARLEVVGGINVGLADLLADMSRSGCELVLGNDNREALNGKVLLADGPS